MTILEIQMTNGRTAYVNPMQIVSVYYSVADNTTYVETSVSSGDYIGFGTEEPPDKVAARWANALLKREAQ